MSHNEVRRVDLRWWSLGRAFMLEAYGKEINGILLSMFPVIAVRREAGQDRWRSDPGQQISFPVAPTERKSFPRGLCVCVCVGGAFWMEDKAALLCLL